MTRRRFCRGFFNQMPVAERKEFVNEFMRIYGPEYHVNGYFQNIIGVLDFMRANGVAGTNTWSSWVDSTILHGFERGLAIAQGRPGGNQSNPGADSWVNFFRYSQGHSEGDTDEKRRLWSEGEEASTSHGYSVAAQRGVRALPQELAFAGPAHLYRLGMRNMETARGLGRGLTNFGGYCPVCGNLGEQAAADFLDPRNTGVTRWGGSIFYTLGEASNFNPLVPNYAGMAVACAPDGRVDLALLTPDEQRLVFLASPESQGRAGQDRLTVPWHLYVQDLPGGQARRIAADFSDHRGMAMAPDGRRVAIAGRRGSEQGVWLVDLTTGALRKISDVCYLGPAFSPDGTRLAVVLEHNESRGELRVLDIGG